jgi:tetratricopeptide (TPR) repeat protein
LGSPKDDTTSDAGAAHPPPASDKAGEDEDLRPRSPSTTPPPLRQRPRTSRSIPPPIPSAERRKRPTLPWAEGVPNQPESPTVVDRALAKQAEVNEAARAEQIAKHLALVALADPAGAANLAYELGERYERRLGDEDRAIQAYRRAFELDASLRPISWALRRMFNRRALWPHLLTLIEVELQRASADHERGELLLERAVVYGHQGSSDEKARIALEQALRLAPRQQGAYLELERVVARAGDRTALLDVWEALADAIEQPERKIAYWLEVAHHAAERDHGRAERALDAAAELAATPRLASSLGPLAERVARERVRIADEHGTPDQIGAALEALVQVLVAAVGPAYSAGDSSTTLPGEHPERARARRELVALRRRQAQLARSEMPRLAWEVLQHALALSPEEPVVLADLIELAGELGRHNDLARLVHIWQAVESDAGRAMMLSLWCAEAHRSADQRERLRGLLRSLEATAPGFLLLTSAAECDALADPSRVRAQLDLANTYLAAAQAAVLGTWLGPRMPARPDPAAAAALYVQAAHLFAYHVSTPAALDQARAALASAVAAAPGHPAVLEALIELDDTTGRPDEALRRLAEMAGTAQGGRAIVERAIRLAYSHGLPEAMLELERDLARLEPDDVSHAWRLEATLAELGQGGERAERAELLGRLAREDTDPARRRAAMLRAARLHERAGAVEPATELYTQLLALGPPGPEDGFTRGALIDLLRSQERWAELASERRAEAHALSDGPPVRRALREAAWVLEICLDDAARAVEVYEDWLARFPGDRTALEGVARCRAALHDHDGEATARAAIAELDQTPEARWLYAHSLERAARYDEAAEQYRSLVAGQDSSVAATSAALALGDLAARGADLAMRVEAADALARRTIDPRLGAALFEDSGWKYIVTLEDAGRAAQPLAAALALEPIRPGALLGAALVAACRFEPLQQGEAYVELASIVSMPEAAVALFLRAAAIADASGYPELAIERVEAARIVAPGNINALLVAAEVGPPPPPDTADPFAAVDRWGVHAEVLGRRGALADDPASRMTWELDRAEALARSGQLREASAVIAAVLKINPHDWRAIAGLRRIAQRADDQVTWAQASYALARLSRDPGWRLRLLRNAVDVYDCPGPFHNPDYSFAIYRQIVAIDPGAFEFERLLEILHERGDARELIVALTGRLTWLSTSPSADQAPMKALLLERSTLLQSLGHHDHAAADLDAILDHAPKHVEALRLRASLAIDAGPRPRRASEPISSPAPGKHHAATILRATRPLAHTARGSRDSSTAEDADDLFGKATVIADLSQLQEQERQLARSALAPPDEYEIEITGQTQARTATAPTASPIVPSADTDFDEVFEDTTGALAGRLSASLPPDLAVPSALAVRVGAADPDELSLEPGRKLRLPALDLAELVPAITTVLEEPPLDVDAIVDAIDVSEDQALPINEAPADLLVHYEAEIAAAGDPVSSVALRIEAGRLSETLGDIDRARTHYDAALLADRRATAALRGLRRLARTQGDLEEVTRLVDAEIAIAGAREKAALLRYRIDLLMATGEHDLARVAVGEALDGAPSDIPALLAQLELACLDDRADEFGGALEQLAHAVADPALRGAMQSARAALAEHHGDTAAAAAWSAAAAEIDPDSPATRLGAIRRAAGQGHGEAAGAALLELAHHVEGADPITAAALAVRAQLWASGETMAAAAQLAARAAPRDPIVARIAAGTGLVAGDRATASYAFARWARCASAPVDRTYAAARAAELEPARLGRLWAQVLEHDPGDDYAAARLRAVHVASGEVDLAIELDLQIAQDTGRDAPLVRAGSELCGQAQVDDAIDALVRGRQQRPTSVAIGEALAEALAQAGRWIDRARLLGELADEPGASARDVARLRSALAWDKAVHAAATDGDTSRDERKRTSVAALDAWGLVLEDDPRSAVAHAARIALASQLDDPRILMDVLVRAQAAERWPWAASSLALRCARLLLPGDPQLAQDIARAASPGLDDPRRTLVVMLAAAHRHDLGEAATALEGRAAALESAHTGNESMIEPIIEPATLRLRAAQLALDAGDPPRAAQLLARVDQILPGVADDLIDAARWRAGDPPPAGALPRAKAGSFARVLRDAELAAARGHGAVALELYQRALEIRPGDPLAAMPLVRLATALREPSPISALALEQLRTAEAMGAPAAKALAYELLARVDELRGDTASARIALEAARRADPGRIDLLHRLEHELAASSRYGELLQLRERQIDQIKRGLGDGGQVAPAGGTRDLVAMIIDAATLAVRARASDDVLARLYRAALDVDPQNHIALLHLESILRRAGFSEELAGLQEHIAESCDDARSQAAFLARAGETLAGLGKPAEAMQRFARAARAQPAYLPAFEAWQEIALTSELWLDLAEAATCRANLGGEHRTVAALHHFAGVALMDKARAREPAVAALRRALELDPSHLDAFVRLRILLDPSANREELATLLRGRLEIESDPAAQIALHRMLGELWYSAGDREAAMQHYRAVLRLDPADVRAHAAIADLASVQSNWEQAANAVSARIPLERDAAILRTLHYRLGVIYAEHDAAKALSAFQSALTCKPGDESSLIQIADVAIAGGEWQVALDACDQLVAAERDPEKLALHFHRAATVFARGLGDQKRAERMLHLAFDSAPTNHECLRLLVAFYRDAGDTTSLRIHLDRIAGLMRSRVAHDVKDGAAYRTLSRAVSMRAENLADGSLPIARAAAELAQLLGASSDVEQRLIAGPPVPEVSLLADPGGDELVFSNAVQPGVLRIFRLLAPPIAKHVGVDLGAHGVGRKDRLPSGDPIAATVRDLASRVGFKDIDVYVSSRHPYLMVAEPTSPVSIVLGSAIASGEPSAIRFAAGAVLKLGQMSLAIPARLPPGELGVLGLALLRLFRPALTAPGVDLDEVNAQMPKLRRLIPAGLFDEVRPHALAIESFSPEGLARDLKIVGLRAGFAASGSVLPGLAALAASIDGDLSRVLVDPVAQALISFALSEDRAIAARRPVP